MPGTGTPKRKQKTRPSQQGCWRSEGPQGRMSHSAGAIVFCWGEPILFKNRRPVAFKAGAWGPVPGTGTRPPQSHVATKNDDN